MTQEKRRAMVRNIAEVPWKEYPDHFGGALSKPLVNPENAGARTSTTASPCTSRWPT